MPRPSLPANPQERATAKAALLRAAASAPTFSRPFVKNGVRITPTSVEVDANGRLVVMLTAATVQGNKPLTLDLPFVYVNPPVLVPDPAGDIPILNEAGTEIVRLRFDAAEAFRQIVADTVARFR